MLVDECYQLGYIKKPHGLKGEVQVFLDTDEPNAYKNLESVFALQGQGLVPFFIESIVIRGDKAIVAFEDIHSVDQAAAMKGAKLYLPLTFLPKLKDHEYYLHELEGFEVIDAATSSPVGIIKGLMEMGPQLTLMLQHASGKEVLVPFSEELQEAINKEQRTLCLKIADGLLDLYLSDED